MRYARLAREAGFNEFIKLEVIGDKETLLPDTDGLLAATQTLVKEGFKVLAYTNDDLITALRLEAEGCAAVMPLASPIGSGLGLLNPYSHPHHQEPAQGAGHRGRRRRHRLRRLPHHGAGGGRHPDEHRPRRGGGPGADGVGHAQRGGGGPRRLARRADAAPRDRRPLEPDHGDAALNQAVGVDARRAALRILREVRDGRPFDAALNGAVGGLTDADRRLAHELAGGVLRTQDALDDRLARLIRLGWDSVSPPLRDLLRLGAYQLLVLDRVPSHAAVSTSVDLAREVAGNSPAGFVNAVLRRLDREAAPAPLVESADPVATLARAHTHPEWLVAGWVARFGAEGTEALLRWNNGRPPLVLQAAREDLTALRERLDAAGIRSEAAPFGAGLVVDATRPGELPGYDEGAFFVQDAAQALVARFADFPRGGAVLDACAAPGGKAIALGRTARILVAAERNRRRAIRLGENLRRAGSGRELAGHRRRGGAPDAAARRRPARRPLPRHRHLRAAPRRAAPRDARRAPRTSRGRRRTSSMAPPRRSGPAGC